MNATPPITEADLHAFVDGQLTPERQRDVETYLAARPEETLRVETYRAQKRELRALFDPVLDEPLPQRVLDAAQPRRPRHTWHLQQMVAGLAIALIGGAAGWGLRGVAPAELAPEQQAGAFARRAAVAHAVFSPDARRPVEVDAAHEDQLVAWLSKRMGAPMKPPRLQALGYMLEGGRVLPGGQGPVAQFMYRDDAGAKLTLYVSNEIAEPGGPGKATSANKDTAFRFAEQGKIKVFYWVDGPFGYAISADADRDALARVSGEVYRQLSVGR